ncbi:hypothetical protein [Vibrio marisflavi]|uniref:3-demethylubiquinone-9 3-methyltransferase n=1 Tax=Vibrio marisflavi CECT 7928 TaxID=634439 RepID=A0ABN8E3X4_9VIBR|nr:hypothetical protein [Vibrio marisflavi]CAH0539592.1 hypothetical protein VMF7928_02267 [Vibrio marisflavi CECT 7928]
METLELQLRKDFYAQIDSLQVHDPNQSWPTLTLLTKEELHELETMWVELRIWKQKQSRL